MGRTEFRQDEHDSLEDDEDSIQDSPKGPTRLIGNGAVSSTRFRTRAFSLIQNGCVRDIVRVSRVECGLVEIAIREGVDGLDIIDQYENVGREYEEESNDAQCTDDVENDENTWKDTSWRHQRGSWCVTYARSQEEAC